MASDLNMVQLIGRLGNDPEIRNTQGGKNVANFSIATTESWRDQNSGERKKKPSGTASSSGMKALRGSSSNTSRRARRST
jgi:hypothetical protein